MTPRQDVILGLRMLFAKGATFSGLLRYLLDHHTPGELTQSAVRACIMQAFGVAFHQRIRMDVEDVANDHAFALIDTYLLPEIIGASSSWYSDLVRDSGSTGWLDNLPAQSSAGTNPPDSAPGKPISGISDASWAALSPAEQARLHQLENSNRTYGSHVFLLAHLCERLQRRIHELTQEESEVRPHSKLA